VLRCFEDTDITHVEGRVDPIADAETVETELMLADLDSLERRHANTLKKAKGGDKDAKAQIEVMEAALAVLREGKPARVAMPDDPEEAKRFQELYLLTGKPVLYVCNVDEGTAATGNDFSARVAEKAAKENAKAV